MANMKIKVRVVDLLARVEAKKAEAEAAHIVALAEWKATRFDRRGICVAALTEALTRAKKNDLPAVKNVYGKGYAPRSHYFDCWAVPGAVEDDDAEPKFDASKFDKDIAFLKMAADEVLAISADDNFGRYL